MRLHRVTLPTLTAAAAVAAGALMLPAAALPAFSTSARHAPDPRPDHPTQIWRVRAADNGGFDRIVFDERFSRSGYRVRYVKHVIADASGKRVHLKGHAFLSVSVPESSTSGAAGTPSEVKHKYTPGLPEVRQIKKTGEFEQTVSFGIGLRHRNGFRVFRMSHPRRLVIDVLH